MVLFYFEWSIRKILRDFYKMRFTTGNFLFQMSRSVQRVYAQKCCISFTGCRQQTTLALSLAWVSLRLPWVVLNGLNSTQVGLCIVQLSNGKWEKNIISKVYDCSLQLTCTSSKNHLVWLLVIAVDSKTSMIFLTFQINDRLTDPPTNQVINRPQTDEETNT